VSNALQLTSQISLVRPFPTSRTSDSRCRRATYVLTSRAVTCHETVSRVGRYQGRHRGRVRRVYAGTGPRYRGASLSISLDGDKQPSDRSPRGLTRKEKRCLAPRSSRIPKCRVSQSPPTRPRADSLIRILRSRDSFNCASNAGKKGGKRKEKKIFPHRAETCNHDTM